LPPPPVPPPVLVPPPPVAVPPPPVAVPPPPVLVVPVLTEMEKEPLSLLLRVSATLMVCVPVEERVKEKTWTPASAAVKV